MTLATEPTTRELPEWLDVRDVFVAQAASRISNACAMCRADLDRPARGWSAGTRNQGQLCPSCLAARGLEHVHDLVDELNRLMPDPTHRQPALGFVQATAFRWGGQHCNKCQGSLPQDRPWLVGTADSRSQRLVFCDRCAPPDLLQLIGVTPPAPVAPPAPPPETDGERQRRLRRELSQRVDELLFAALVPPGAGAQERNAAIAGAARLRRAIVALLLLNDPRAVLDDALSI